MAFFGEGATKRHNKYNAGPWLGIHTNVADLANNTPGALKIARNVWFERVQLGKGTQTPAVIRDGRQDYITDIWPRAYMTEGESGETYTFGGAGPGAVAQVSTEAYAGYGSLEYALSGAGNLDMFKTLPGLADVTQDGGADALSDHNIVLWVKVDTPANVDAAATLVQITSDIPVVSVFTDFMSAPLSAFPAWATIVANTWTKLILPLSSFTANGAWVGTPDIELTKISGVRFRVHGTAAVTVHMDEFHIETTAKGNVVGMGEFFKATTGERFLLYKAGNTLYIDEDDNKAPRKVVSNLAFDTPGYFTKVYNQIFFSDGTDMYMIDGTQNAAGAYEYRNIGFPVPNGSGVSETSVAGGTDSTVGVHRIGISYIYGADAATIYGESNVVDVGTITISATERYEVTSLPVPTEAEGVQAIRIYVGLAGSSEFANKYFAEEVAAGVTSSTFDISDAFLTALGNPVGAIDNDLPPVSKYTLAYEGSLLYIRQSLNPTALVYSKRGTDLQSGPEATPTTSIAVNQIGDPWTGGVVRNGILYLFTLRSVHKARFGQSGILEVRELDQQVAGSSVSTGAVDQNGIWVDDEANIMFESEYGICAIDGSDRIHFISKRAMKDEWRDVNRVEPVSSFTFRTFTSSADWSTGVLGVNTSAIASPGELQYSYGSVQNNNATTALVDPSLGVGNRTVNPDLGYGNINSNDTFSGSSFFPASQFAYLYFSSGSVFFPVLALKPMRITQFRLGGQFRNSAGGAPPPGSTASFITVNIRSYKYEAQNTALLSATAMGASLGPGAGHHWTSAGAQSDTSRVGGTILTSAAASTRGSANHTTPIVFNFPGNGIYVPQGEMVWIEVDPVFGPGHETFRIFPDWSPAGVSQKLGSWSAGGLPVSGIITTPAEGSAAMGVSTIDPGYTDVYGTVTPAAAGSSIVSNAALPGQYGPGGAGGSGGYAHSHAAVGLAVVPVPREVIWETLVVHPLNQVQRYGDFFDNVIDFAGSALFTQFMEVSTTVTGPWVSRVVTLFHLYADFAGLVDTTSSPSVKNFFQRSDYRPLDPAASNKVDNNITRTEHKLLMDHFAYTPGWGLQFEADAHVSTSFVSSFLPSALYKYNYSTEAYPLADPFPSDIWTSPVIDMKITPTAWGKFFLDFDEQQQAIVMEVRTSASAVFATTPTYSVVTPNSIPALTTLASNGRYIQVRFIFTDKDSVFIGTKTTVRTLSFSWIPPLVKKIAPIVSPAGTFFERLHLLAYAPLGSATNRTAWCLSPGGATAEFERRFKISQWTGQNVNNWLIFNGELLAGMGESGKITKYFKGDYQDEGIGVIGGQIRTLPTHLGFDDRVKTIEAVEVYTSTVLIRRITPTVQGVDILPDLSPFAAPNRTLFSIAPAPRDIYYPAAISGEQTIVSYYGRPHLSSTAPLAGFQDMFSPDITPVQEQYVVLEWSAFAHQILSPAAPGTPAEFISVFPFLSNIRPLFYVENFTLDDQVSGP